MRDWCGDVRVGGKLRGEHGRAGETAVDPHAPGRRSLAGTRPGVDHGEPAVVAAFRVRPGRSRRDLERQVPRGSERAEGPARGAGAHREGRRRGRHRQGDIGSCFRLLKSNFAGMPINIAKRQRTDIATS